MRLAVMFGIVALLGCAPASSPSEAAPETAPSEAPRTEGPPPEASSEARESPTGPPCPAPYVRGDELGWPDDPDRLLAHLDGWDRSELEAYARPELDPQRTTSGETNAWVRQHLEQLEAMGVEVVWNADERCYARAAP